MATTPEKLPLNDLKVLGKIIRDTRLSAKAATSGIDFSKIYQAVIVKRCMNPADGTKPLEIAATKEGPYYVYKVRILEEIVGETLGSSILPTVEDILASVWLNPAPELVNVLYSLMPEAVFLKSGKAPPLLGAKVYLQPDNIEGRYIIRDAPPQKGRATPPPKAKEEAKPSTSFEDEPKEDKSIPVVDKEDKSIPVISHPELAVEAPKPTKNGTKVYRMGPKCIDRKLLTVEQYYQKELEIFEKDRIECMVAARVNVEDLTPLGDCERAYEKKIRDAQWRKTLPSCHHSKGPNTKTGGTSTKD